jgi:hypothetical protein
MNKKYKCGIFEESLIVLYRDRVYRVSYPGSKWRINSKGRLFLLYIPESEKDEFSFFKFEYYTLLFRPQTINYFGKISDRDIRSILEYGKKI